MSSMAPGFMAGSIERPSAIIKSNRKNFIREATINANRIVLPVPVGVLLPMLFFSGIRLTTKSANCGQTLIGLSLFVDKLLL